MPKKKDPQQEFAFALAPREPWHRVKGTPLDTPEVIEALGDLEAHRKERKDKPWGEMTWKVSLRRWEEWGPALLVEAIEEKIANNWQGVFRPKEKGYGRRTATPRRADGSRFDEPEEPMRKFKLV